MNGLSYMERLLDGVDVKWKPLGTIATVKTGGAVNKQRISDNPGPYAVINSGREPLGFINEWNTENDPIGITSRGAGVGSITWQEGRYFRGNLNYAVTVKPDEKITVRYLYHLLLQMQSEIQALCTFDGIPALNAGNLKELDIPIPCPENPEKSLQIQAEIVRILDAFSSLTAELIAELTARKKQYNYYRDKLLSFGEGEVEWKPLGAEDVGRFIRGAGLQKKDFTETGVGCIHYGQIYTHYGTYANITKTCVSKEFAQKAKKAQSGDLVIATTSENDEDVCKAVAWIGSDDIAVSSDACIYQHNLNSKYVSYFFQTEHFQKQKRPFITGTKVRRVNADNLAKILMPIPTVHKQNLIVEILDKFDTLTNSITEGLPREIELRQKQYEYYRDLLLSFPKPDEKAA